MKILASEMKINLAMDSGAHSLHTRNKKGAGLVLREYMDKYIEWCKSNSTVLDFYVTLDIIHDTEATLNNTKYMMRKGLVPLPVLHYGAEPTDIQPYLDNHQYLGLSIGGGIPPTDAYREWCNKVFKLLGKEHKVHGFASTAWKLLTLPWYSVDSTTPFGLSRTGSILVPQISGDRMSYDKPRMFTLTVGGNDKRPSIRREGDNIKEAVKRYVKGLGFSMKDATEHYHVRDVINMWYMYQAFKSKPIRYYVSGRTGTQIKNIPGVLWHLARLGMPKLYYLGTFFDLDPFHIVRNLAEQGLPTNCPAIQHSEARLENQVKEHRFDVKGNKISQPSAAPSGLHSGADAPVFQQKPYYQF